MLVDVVAVHVVEMPLVQVVHMIAMVDGHVAATRAVDVGMIAVLRRGAGRHFWPPSLLKRLDSSLTHCAGCKTTTMQLRLGRTVGHVRSTLADYRVRMAVGERAPIASFVPPETSPIL
jgi:hypothetical protein